MPSKKKLQLINDKGTLWEALKGATHRIDGIGMYIAMMVFGLGSIIFYFTKLGLPISDQTQSSFACGWMLIPLMFATYWMQDIYGGNTLFGRWINFFIFMFCIVTFYGSVFFHFI